MNFLRLFVLSVALLSLAGVSFAVPVSPTPVTACGVLSTNGAYVLTGNLNGVRAGSTECILINNSFISLDCNGFAINDSHQGWPDYAGVKVNNNYSGVQNCKISGYFYGILDASGSVNNNYNRNILTRNTFGLYVINAQGHLIHDNVFSNNSYNGIYLYLDRYFSVISNNASFNPYSAFFIGSTGNSNFTDNLAYSSKMIDGQYTYYMGSGFSVTSSSHDNQFIRNTAYDNYDGFSFGPHDVDGTFINNTAYDNNRSGFYINSYGMVLDGARAYGNKVAGITATAACSFIDLSILNSFIYNNPWAINASVPSFMSGILNVTNTQLGASSVNVSLYDAINDDDNPSLLVNDTGAPSSPPEGYAPLAGYVLAYPQPGNAVVQSFTIHYDEADLGGRDESGIRMFNYGNEWTQTPGQSLNTSANTVTAANYAGGGAAGLFIRARDNCVVIDEPGTYTMQNDFVGAPNPAPFVIGPYGSWSGSLACVEILSSNVVFDCDGHSITDDEEWPSGYRYGVVISESNNVTLKNCHNISGYGNNVNLNYVTNALIANNTLTDSHWGAYSYLSSYFNAVDNGLYSNLYGGFVILGGDGNNLTRNTVAHGWNGVSASYSNNLRITGDHYYDNLAYGYGHDLSLNAGESYPHVYLSNVIFDNPLGNYQNFTNLSMDDYIDKYVEMTWAQNEYALPAGYASFAQKFIDIESGGRRPIYYYSPLRVASLAGPNAASLDNGHGYGGNEDDIDSITWSWRDDELAGYTESKFGIWRYNGVWAQEDAALNTAANTLTITHLQPASLYGILANTGGEPNPTTEPSFRVVVRGPCSNTITVTSSGNAVEGATVTVDGASYTTDSAGQVAFQGCGKTVTIRVAKSGYAPVEITRALAMCSECRQCTSDDQCASTEQCAVGRCTPVTCTCGVVQDHQCSPYACCSDSQCAAGEACVDHQCVKKPKQPGCGDNSDCSATERCDKPAGATSGKCVAVQGCGRVDNHQIAEAWQCGGAGCPACPEGYVCIGHTCMKGVVTAPTNLYVGDNPTVHAEANGKPCANCQIQVTDPAGRTTTATTDEDGNMEIPLKAAGAYKVTLVQGDVPLSSVTIKALTKPAIGLTGLPTSVIREQDIPLLLIILLLAGILVVYFRSRGKKK